MITQIASPRLGRLEIVGEISEVKRSDDYVVILVQNPGSEDKDSVIALDHYDVIRLLWLMARIWVLVFLIKGFRNRNNPRRLPFRW